VISREPVKRTSTYFISDRINFETDLKRSYVKAYLKIHMKDDHSEPITGEELTVMPINEALVSGNMFV
jgi:hypothetical protein